MLVTLENQVSSRPGANNVEASIFAGMSPSPNDHAIMRSITWRLFLNPTG
jgi:hypothetical protein